MAKGKRPAPVAFNKQAFLLPAMEATEYGFYVRELGGRALLEFKEAAEKFGKDAELNVSNGLQLLALLVARGTCDKAGHPVFTDDDVQLLADKSPAFLQDIAKRVLTLSGVPASFLKNFDEVTVNLPNDQLSSSTTA